MSNDITPKNSELLTDLSEQEQEIVSGGRSSSFELRDFFFQRTNIRSSANSGFNSSQDGVSFGDQSGYMYSQTTMSIGSLILGGGRKRRKSKGSSYNDFLSLLLLSLWYS
ncbi:hypothetical protein SD80_013370 [Scytonema tolypothrichoides VB-61278]|nr:hypothetical protein SD80_013370 [Scytonema tolypothrichoides VB-61278]